MALIDKEQLKAEIRRRLSLIYLLKGDFTDGSRDAYEGLLSWLDTLPERPNHLDEALELVAEYNLKPYRDGNAWCILLGKDIQSGICGFGDTILDAMLEFKKEYDSYVKRTHLYPAKEQPVEWKDEYREEDLRTRFAFYTYKTEEDDGILYISNVFVEEASRNAGFGTKILEAAERVAETIGAITIRLKVKQDSPANAWYRKHGYGYIAFEGDYDWLEKNLEYLKPKRNKQPVEGLEEECERFYRTDEYKIADNLGRGFETIARHFAEWGKNNLK